MSGMKRAAFDERDDQDRPSFEAKRAPMPCRVCGKLTPVATLSDFGARCYSCYAAYLQQAVPQANVPPEAVPASAPLGLAWAHRLKFRHANGERLTAAQVTAYRAALRLDRSAQESAP